MRKEGMMRKYSYPAIGGILVMIISLCLIFSSGLMSKEKKDIRFKWKGPPTVEDKITKQIEKDNDKLVKMLEELKRINPPLDKFIEKAEKDLEKTYLKNPILTIDDEEFSGWDAIVRKLKEILEGTETVEITAVDVSVEFKAYDPDIKPGVDEDIDYHAYIKTSFSLQAADPDIRGELRHRRICTYEF
jgi:hypothetical protein